MKNSELVAILPDNNAQALIEFRDFGGPYHSAGLIVDIEPADTAIYADYPRQQEGHASEQLKAHLVHHEPDGNVQIFHPATCRCGVAPGDSWFELARVRTYASGNRVVLIAGALRSTT